MKYKQAHNQNQRIKHITESTLVVGADIAKKKHVASVVDYCGIELEKDCVFGNDHVGLTKLVDERASTATCQDAHHLGNRANRTLPVSAD